MCKDLLQSDSSNNKNKEKSKNITTGTFYSVADDVIAVIDYLNNRTGRHFRYFGGNSDFVRDALEGRGHLRRRYTVADLKLVIDWKMVHWDVVSDPNRTFSSGKPVIHYMQPKTLFSFENLGDFLEQAELWRDGANVPKPKATERKVIVRNGPPI